MRDEFLITRHGKQYVLFAGLMEEAHERGLRGIDTELLQLPSDENAHTAVAKATVEMDDGHTFSGLGDASPENVSRSIAVHLIRMAETRAKARALGDAVNVGATALEELSDGDDAPPGSSHSAGENATGSGTRSGPHPIPQNASRVRQGARRSPGPRPAEEDGQSKDTTASSSRRSGGRSGKARKSQVDLLETLAVELRGEGGVKRLEERIGKSLSDLTRGEADEWIDCLSPAHRDDEA